MESNAMERRNIPEEKVNLLIYGAGGFGREVYEIAKHRLGFQRNILDTEILFIDDNTSSIRIPGSGNIENKVLHPEELGQLDVSDYKACIAVGTPHIRHRLFDKVKEYQLGLFTIVDSSSIVSASCSIGEGTIVGPKAIVSTNARIGKNVVINAGAIIGHDVEIGDHAVINPGAIILGGVIIGSETLIGAGSTIMEYVKIGKNSKIAMNASVYRDIDDYCVAAGNPARVMVKNRARNNH